MNPEHLHLLACPKTHKSLIIKEISAQEGLFIRTGILVEPDSGNEYPVVDFIPRFVPEENYADNFGIEWNIHDRTQYDESSGFSVSQRRFEEESKWGNNLSGETVLEIGSGSGRFTKYALDTGATVASFDFSSAVEANYRSNGGHKNLLLVQASVYEMPFKENSFDRAFCFGVLQHTPDPRDSFRRMIGKVKPGGYIASDIYAKSFTRWALKTKYWVRPFINKDNPEKLYASTKKYVDFMWPLARIIRKIPKVGHSINFRLLVADYSKVLPDADDDTLRQWAYLNTYDMLSPHFDIPQTLKTFRRWHAEEGLGEIDVHYGYNGVEGRGRKPGTSSM